MNSIPEYFYRYGEHRTPDSANPELSSPNPSHVMSRNDMGDVVSRYEDNIWDFSSYPGQHKFVFSDSSRYGENFSKEIIAEQKCLIFSIMYKNQDISSISSVYFYLSTIRAISIHARETDQSIKSVLSDPGFFTSITEDKSRTKNQIGHRLRHVRLLYINLNKISQISEDFDYLPSNRAFTYLQNLCNEYPAESQQTPIIPTRLLSQRIKTCFSYLDLFLSFENDLMSLISHRLKLLEKHKNAALASGLQKDAFEDDFAKIWSRPRYEAFFESFSIKDFSNIYGLVGRLRLPMREMIHCFTGMRSREVQYLSLNGYQIKTIGEEKVPVIRSYTTKMAKDSGYFADWFTSPEIERVFKVGSILNDMILKLRYNTTLGKQKKEDIPLFLGSKGGLEKSDSKIHSGLFAFPIAKNSLRYYKEHPIDQDPTMIFSQEDLDEIRSVDPHFDPNLVKGSLEIGRPFQFQGHMYRRSLAVYTARSGLVSLPALKHQLKHMYLQTSSYYSLDANYAKDFLLPRKQAHEFETSLISQRGFIKEFQDEIAEGESQLIEDQVLSEDQVVFGGYGTQLEKQKRTGNLPTVYTDRAKTKKAIKEGRLRYSETPLGGCTSIEVCERVAFSSITTCIGCGEAIFNNRSVPLLKRTKQEYKDRLKRFGTDSPHGMQLAKDIKDIDQLLLTREKLIDIKMISGS